MTQFTIGVFSVSLVGGLVLTIGPGRLLLGLVPHPQGTVRHVIELVAGVVLLIVAVRAGRATPRRRTDLPPEELTLAVWDPRVHMAARTEGLAVFPTVVE